MAIRQLSIYVENKPGKLTEIAKTIKEADINIRAMSIADTKEFGILRLIVSDTDKAKEILSKVSIVKATDVVAVEMKDEVGSLYEILKALSDGGVDVDYMYAFTTSDEYGAYVALRVADTAQAEAILKAAGASIL